MMRLIVTYILVTNWHVAKFSILKDDCVEDFKTLRQNIEWMTTKGAPMSTPISSFSGLLFPFHPNFKKRSETTENCTRALTQNITKQLFLLTKRILHKANENRLAVVSGMQYRDMSDILNISKEVGVDLAHFNIRKFDSFSIKYVINAIVDTSIKTVLVLLEDAEWKMLSDFIIDSRKHLFWIRLTQHDRLQQRTRTASSCFYNLPIISLMSVDTDNHQSSSNKQETIQAEILANKYQCVHRVKPILRVVGLLHVPFMEQVLHRYSQSGEIVCEPGSYVCQKATNNINGTSTWTSVCCAGYTIDVLAEVLSRAGFDWSLYVVPDNKYGAFTDCQGNNHSTTCGWNGAVNEVFMGRADVGAIALTEKHQRFEVVEFSENILVTNLAIAVRISALSKLPFINWKFLESLHWTFPVALLVTLLLVGVFIFFLEKSLRSFYRATPFGPCEVFSYAAGLTFHRDLEKKAPLNWSTRLVSISYALATTILLNTYTAKITASNIIQSDSFKGLKDEKILNPSADFVFGIPRSTSTEMFFKTDADYVKAYRFATKYLVDGGNKVGVEKVYNGDLDAFIGEYHGIGNLVRKPRYCSSIKIYREEKAMYNSFATAKGSKLNGIISQGLREIKFLNGLDPFARKWFLDPTDCLEKSFEIHKFTMEYVGGLVVAVAAFTALAVLILIVENVYFKLRRKSNLNTVSIKNRWKVTSHSTG